MGVLVASLDNSGVPNLFLLMEMNMINLEESNNIEIEIKPRRILLVMMWNEGMTTLSLRLAVLFLLLLGHSLQLAS
jgi:hypothetical protein